MPTKLFFPWVLMVWTCWLFQISVPQTSEEFEPVDGGFFLTRHRLCKFTANERKSTLPQIKETFQNVHMFLQLQGGDCVQIHFINLTDIPSVPTSPRVASRRVRGAQALSKVADKFQTVSSQRSFIRRETGNIQVTSVIKATPQWKRADVGWAT